MSFSSHSFHPGILREYDIRGTYGETLGEADAFLLGTRFARKLPEASTVCVGWDGRLSSPPLSKALMEGLREAGCHVVSVGCGPTPLLYFAVHHFQAAGGIMITGSHNPPQENGFKLTLKDGPFYGAQIQELAKEGPAVQLPYGTLREVSLIPSYIERILRDHRGKKPLKVAWDPGNGAAGEVVEQLIPHLQSLVPGSQHILLNTEINGTFPNHHPDPSDPKNLVQLQEAVQKEGCDLGIAFDGDGDRIGVIDGLGRMIWGDQLMIFFARAVLAQNPGALVIGDVKCSRLLFQEIEKAGGRPLLWKTGHSHIKAKMKAEGALLAGEMSGHVFFADSYEGYDDAPYAAIRLLSLLQTSEEPLSVLYENLPKTFASPELRLPYGDDQKFLVIEKLKKHLQDQGVSYEDIDGIRCETAEGWWLLRASHTQGAIVARFEANSPELLESLQTEVKKLLEIV